MTFDNNFCGADRGSQQDDIVLPCLIARARNSEIGDSLGFCLGCGERIPENRMVARPRGTRCVACQELAG